VLLPSSVYAGQRANLQKRERPHRKLLVKKLINDVHEGVEAEVVLWSHEVLGCAEERDDRVDDVAPLLLGCG
jgi:hypothetical protein